MTEPLVRIRGLGKSFGPTRVLEGVDLDVGRGEAVVVIEAYRQQYNSARTAASATRPRRSSRKR